jgi:hypothetical protein
MDEGSGYEHTSTEVTGYKEELVGDGYRGKALDDDGEGASCDTVSSAPKIREATCGPAVLSVSIKNKANTCMGVL